ncbi:GNAT family N-acetyltransferase [Actinoplanes sp. N902-109]|uniref:GNAT family N-acetyltransferase n=1 Tax=Actinoplanes sp. (strain N902-109) TaxID=649831 RepID=UPI00032948D4|nr:GNAT family protein [Actinoplanes sp. N902-109]AGL20772.1 GCN5-like N-acetyltransferase [Actinoplanes sp. N902-109]
MRPDDAAELVREIRDNWDFLAPFEPARDPDYFTEAGQRELIVRLLAEHERGVTLPYLAVLDGRIVGRFMLTGIVRGPLQSGSLGYWVSADVNGRGVATAAAGELIRVAFEELGLHRVEASTQLDNFASQRVLAKLGFVQFGTAPRFLHINGAWRDHHLFQLLNEPG